MKQAVLLTALMTALATALMLPFAAAAAGPAAKATPGANLNLVDFSAANLIDAAAAKTVMADNIPAKVAKLYPANKWAFVSQVQGGVTTAGMCVVTARVMLLPLTPTVKAVMLRPNKTATSFDAAAGSNADACKAMARDKLKEATVSVMSGLAKS
jgi:hypothetical protein